MRPLDRLNIAILNIVTLFLVALTSPLPKISDRLSQWYGSIPPRRMDIVSELEGVPVIHGESLVLHVTTDCLPDFDLDVSTMAAIRYAESYLELVRSRFPEIHVVWLDGLKVAMTGSQWVVREILKNRLTVSDNSHTFFSWDSPDFEDFTTQNPIAFLLLSESPLAVEGTEKGLLAFALSLISRSVRIAFLYGLDVRGHRLVAFSAGAEALATDSGLVAASQSETAEWMGEEEDEEETATPAADKKGAISAAIKLVLEQEDNPQRAILVEVVGRLICATAIVADSLTLSERSFATLKGEDWPALFGREGFIVEVVHEIAEKVAEIISVSGITDSDVFDLRLLRTVAYAALSKPGVPLDESIGLTPAGLAQLKSIWSLITNSDVASLPALAAKLPAPSIPSLPPRPLPPSDASLVPISVPLVDSILSRASPSLLSAFGSVEAAPAVYVSEDSPITGFVDSLTLLLEWHKDKEDADQVRYTAWMKNMSAEKRASKMKTMEIKFRQRQKHSLHLYAKSLSGHDKLHYPIIVDEGKMATKEAANKDVLTKDSVRPASAKTSSKAQQIIAANVAKQQEKQSSKDDDQIQPLLEKAEKLGECQSFASLESGLLDFLSGISRILDSFDGFNGISSAVKLRSGQAKVILAAIKAAKSSLKVLARTVAESASHEATARQITARLLRLCATFIRDYTDEIDGRGILRVQDLLLSVGLPKMSLNLFEDWVRKNPEGAFTEKGERWMAKEDDEKKKSKKEEKKEDKKEDKKKSKKQEDEGANQPLPPSEFYLKPRKVEPLMELAGQDERLFQLFFLGADLDRPIGTKSDERVMFKPDNWQRRLLDIVDSRESALVCAPTASGKTFICYYAIEQVLRTDNDSIAVYVAPSKALLNQVEAEIYVRFSSKKYPANSSMELAGTLSTEYSKNVSNCQVLITLPGMLEQLFVSPQYNAVARRIKYVILDEVHCIGDQDGALAWEHCIQLLPCPFLALSATVGNPKVFYSWLESTAEARGNPKVHFIEYKERFNDIQKNVFGIDGNIYPLHPYACLAYKQVKAGAIPADLVLTPVESAVWYGLLKQTLKTTDLSFLQPSEYFSGCRSVVTKKEFRFYERTLFKVTCDLLKSGIIDEAAFDSLSRKLLASRRLGDSESVNAQWSEVATGKAPRKTENGLVPDKALAAPVKRYAKPADLNTMLRKLESCGLLPTILFNFDRGEINKMVEDLAEYLQQRQWKKYHGTEERSYRTKQENKKRKDAYEALLARRDLMLKKKRSEEDYDETEAADDVPPPPLMVEEEYDAEFYFAGVRAMGDPDIDEMINKLKGPKVRPIYIEALRRGIGMHHEGCNTRYRRTVEILFRRGFLRVVIATGTLALGINMPCKSTVFTGASVELNGLMFKQMSGRAGRRGFDLIGHVVFTDAAWADLSRVVCAEVASLHGDFSLTATTTLRLMQLQDELHTEIPMGANKQVQAALTLQGKEEEQYLKLTGNSAVFTGFLARNQQLSLDDLVVLFRFQLDLLMKDGLLTPGGHIQGLGSLAAALAEEEPANLGIVRVIASGKLESLVSAWTAEEALDKSGDIKKRVSYRLMELLSNWCLVCPQLRGFREGPKRERLLPSPASPLLAEPELEGVPKVADHNKTVIAHAVERARFHLKLKGLVAEPKVDEKNIHPSGTVFRILEQQRIVGTIARNPEIATAGLGDEFSSVSELVLSTNRAAELMIDSSVVPVIEERAGSYALDFLAHGKLAYLTSDNLLSATQAWRIVDQWRSFLWTMCRALEKGGREQAIDTKAIKSLYEELKEKLLEEGA